MKNLKKFNQFRIFESKDNQEVKQWALFAGLGGGFGGATFRKKFEGTKDEAEREAWLEACEEYETYEGLHGLRDLEQIMEEDDLSEEDAMVEYNEEREGWLDYYVEEYDETKDYE